MKNYKTLIFLLSSALIFAWDASSQTIPEKVYYERSHSLYNGEGDKMTKEEIKGLEEYGFDYDKWRKLNNRLVKGFHNSVRRCGHYLKPCCKIFHSLMMVAVDR